MSLQSSKKSPITSSTLSLKDIRTLTVAIGLALLLAGCGGSASLEATTNPGLQSQQATGQPTVSPMVFRQFKLTDPELGGMTASSLLVPEEWTVKGGLQRMPPQLFAMPVIADVNISAPDGRGVHLFPAMNFSFGQSMRGLQIMQPTINGNPYYPLPESVGSWVLELANMSPDPSVSGLRMIKEEQVPEVTQQLRQAQAQRLAMVEQNNRQYAYLGVATSFDTQATQLVFTYQKRGRQIEETMLVLWEAELSLTNGQVTQGRWGVSTMTSMRGPVGVDYQNDQSARGDHPIDSGQPGLDPADAKILGSASADPTQGTHGPSTVQRPSSAEAQPNL